jgi:alpha-ketoglutarate-dependent taurine dioxygenase
LLAQGYIYARNYGDEIGLSWQNAFQTSERAEVEDYCRRMHIDFEWLGGGRLRTRQRRPVVARHPASGDAAWFNHLTFFHVTTLAPDLRDALRSQLTDHELPNNTYYGNGGDLEPEVVEALRGAYLEEKVSFPWQRGDVLMVDNLLTSHAREPFRGERRVLTAMTQPVSWDQVSTEDLT